MLEPPAIQDSGRRLRLALAQVNPTVGDLDANAAKIIDYIAAARAEGADLVAFPELALTGYPPEDLLLKPGFLRANLEALEQVRKASVGIVVVTGFVEAQEDIYNAAAVLADGHHAGTYRKTFLPNYGVFDEDRYFQRGGDLSVFQCGSLRFGVTICEDIWYAQGPAHAMATVGGAQLIVNINASPYHAEKWRFREKMLATRAADSTCFVAYVNMVGGQDELVFDGHSLVVGPRGAVVKRGPMFQEGLLLADLDLSDVLRARLADPRHRKERRAQEAAGVRVETLACPVPSSRPPAAPPAVPPALLASEAGPPERCAEIYQALVTGTRDYVQKSGFRGVVIGISGGIDSALVAAIAVDALGADRVTLVSMPSTFSSGETQSDAARVAQNLGTHFHEIPIKALQDTWAETLGGVFAGTERGVAEENLQARSRGNILMALSNKFGWLVLTTGNKSEMACGYATLYGDMAGGYAVIKDVPKTLVYELCAWRNRDSEAIPRSIIERPPSAELRPNQKDSDSLPEYDALDPIIHAYVEEDRSLDEMVAIGLDRDTAHRVIMMIDRNEYKRRQAPPGVKITPKAFGRDRRLPITNRFHDV